MARFIAIAQLKGGAGKSTLATNLAGYLSREMSTIRLNADIPEELHKKIKIAAATQGVSIKDILVDLINKHL